MRRDQVELSVRLISPSSPSRWSGRSRSAARTRNIGTVSSRSASSAAKASSRYAAIMFSMSRDRTHRVFACPDEFPHLRGEQRIGRGISLMPGNASSPAQCAGTETVLVRGTPSPHQRLVSEAQCATSIPDCSLVAGRKWRRLSGSWAQLGRSIQGGRVTQNQILSIPPGRLEMTSAPRRTGRPEEADILTASGHYQGLIRKRPYCPIRLIKNQHKLYQLHADSLSEFSMSGSRRLAMLIAKAMAQAIPYWRFGRTGLYVWRVVCLDCP